MLFSDLREFQKKNKKGLVEKLGVFIVRTPLGT
jgi:hypothetical protein